MEKGRKPNQNDNEFELAYVEWKLYPAGEKGRKERNAEIKKIVDKKPITLKRNCSK